MRYFQRVLWFYEEMGKYLQPLSQDKFDKFFTEAQTKLDMAEHKIKEGHENWRWTKYLIALLWNRAVMFHKIWKEEKPCKTELTKSRRSGTSRIS